MCCLVCEDTLNQYFSVMFTLDPLFLNCLTFFILLCDRKHTFYYCGAGIKQFKLHGFNFWQVKCVTQCDEQKDHGAALTARYTVTGIVSRKGQPLSIFLMKMPQNEISTITVTCCKSSVCQIFILPFCIHPAATLNEPHIFF